MAQVPHVTPSVSSTARKGPRFYLGLFFFVLFLTAPAFIPLVFLLPLPPAWQAILSAGLAFGLPEVFAIVAVALLGRENFERLLRPVKRLLLRLAPQFISRRRHVIGISLLTTALLEAMLFLHLQDWRHLFEGHFLAHALAWDTVLVGSAILLGSSFWQKVQKLFVRDVKRTAMELPASDECENSVRARSVSEGY